jgi:ubiquinone/menaquinone biosynthesis C-methylase UbiE
MDIKELQRNWNERGKRDPFLSVLWLPEKIRNKWDRTEFFQTGTVEVDTTMEWVQSLGVVFPRSRALDFGCGPGRLTQALATHFDEVVGVDIAPSMLKVAKKYSKAGNKCEYYLNENPDLSMFTDSSFSFVLSIIVLQHMRPDYAKEYVKEFLRIVSPGGLIVFQMPHEKVTNPPKLDASTWQEPDRDGFTIRMKQRIKKLMPGVALRVYRNLVYGDPEKEPISEMHGIPRSEIERLVAENRGQVIGAVPHPGGGLTWKSLQYCIVKM